MHARHYSKVNIIYIFSASKKKNYCTRGIKQVHRDVRKGGRGLVLY